MSSKQTSITRTLTLVELAEKAKLYAKSGRASSTVRAYKSDWNDFQAWCRSHEVDSLPATPETVAIYIADKASSLAAATISRRLISITEAHKAAGYENSPAGKRHSIVTETMKGIRRVLGIAQKGKRPLLIGDIRKIAAECPKTAAGHRDRLLILLGFAGAFRRSELANLRVQDLTIYKDGVVVELPRSKTDQEGEGRKVGIARGERAFTCPLRALDTWLKLTAIKSGPLLRPVSRGGKVLGRGLHPDSIGRIVKIAAVRAGLDPRALAGHSLRSGLATQAAIAKCTDRDIMRQTGHRSVKTLQRYIRDARILQESPSSRLGL